MAEVYEGQCQCGAVSYRVTGQSLALFACHCSECQRQSSSAFGMALWVKQSSVELTSGSLRSWVRSTPSGSIKPGTPHDSKWLQPVGHIWSERAQPWVEFGSECLVYPQNPDGFDAMFEAWKAKMPRRQKQ